MHGICGTLTLFVKSCTKAVVLFRMRLDGPNMSTLREHGWQAERSRDEFRQRTSRRAMPARGPCELCAYELGLCAKRLVCLLHVYVHVYIYIYMYYVVYHDLSVLNDYCSGLFGRS